MLKQGLTLLLAMLVCAEPARVIVQPVESAHFLSWAPFAEQTLVFPLGDSVHPIVPDTRRAWLSGVAGLLGVSVLAGAHVIAQTTAQWRKNIEATIALLIAADPAERRKARHALMSISREKQAVPNAAQVAELLYDGFMSRKQHRSTKTQVVLMAVLGSPYAKVMGEFLGEGLRGKIVQISLDMAWPSRNSMPFADKMKILQKLVSIEEQWSGRDILGAAPADRDRDVTAGFIRALVELQGPVIQDPPLFQKQLRSILLEAEFDAIAPLSPDFPLTLHPAIASEMDTPVNTRAEFLALLTKAFPQLNAFAANQERIVLPAAMGATLNFPELLIQYPKQTSRIQSIQQAMNSIENANGSRLDRALLEELDWTSSTLEKLLTDVPELRELVKKWQGFGPRKLKRDVFIPEGWKKWTDEQKFEWFIQQPMAILETFFSSKAILEHIGIHKEVYAKTPVDGWDFFVNVLYPEGVNNPSREFLLGLKVAIERALGINTKEIRIKIPEQDVYQPLVVDDAAKQSLIYIEPALHLTNADGFKVESFIHLQRLREIYPTATEEEIAQVIQFLKSEGYVSLNVRSVHQKQTRYWNVLTRKGRIALRQIHSPDPVASRLPRTGA